MAPSSLTALLELLDGPRPVTLQQPRQGSIGEQLSTGLAGRAVVGLILGVDDALDRCAAHGARLTVLAVHRHVFPKRRDFLGKSIARLTSQTISPFGEHLVR